jgi:hypothetical protein
VNNTLGKKLAKETYEKHENNAKNVRMWARVNPNVKRFVLLLGDWAEVGGGLSGSNIPFTIRIQTP